MYGDTLDNVFNQAVSGLLPIAAVIALFAALNAAVAALTASSCIEQLFFDGVSALFPLATATLGSGLLYLLLNNVMWFFGIHGGNMLDSVAQSVFVPGTAANAAALAAGGEPVQIVCGAPNIAAGIKVPVACVGAVLPGDLKIKKSKLRGVPSCGMCCSQRELGMGGDHAGIWVLPEDAPVGVPIADYAQLADTVLDLEITPNRPDCLSMVGMAREVGAMYRTDYESPLAGMAGKLALDASAAPVDETVKITIEDAARCPRYTARVIRGVKVGPSPDWMVERLAAIGQRSINNIVDVTNYILFLFGQPLHAFDLDKLKAWRTSWCARPPKASA